MNISDIAKLAGVSPATVSRCLNDGCVGKKKREKILRVIAQTGYMPKGSLPKAQCGIGQLIAVITPLISMEIITEILEGITKQLDGTDYFPLLISADSNVQLELEYLRLFRDNEIEGVLFIASYLTPEHYDILNSYQKPIVIINRRVENCSCVYFNDYEASKLAVKRLISDGCTKIAHIYLNPENNSADRDKIDACYDAIMDGGLTYEPRFMLRAEPTIDGGRHAMSRLIDDRAKFDGLFCSADILAFGALKLLELYRIPIPERLSVTAIGSSRYNTAMQPSITCVKYDYCGAGREACRILLEEINGYSPIRQYRLGHELIEGDSTKIIWSI